MRSRIIHFACIVILSFQAAWAQDTLVYLNGERIVGKVQEIGTTTVRYSTASGANEVVVVSDKSELQRVVLQNGQRFDLNTSRGAGTSEAFFGRKNAISLDLLAPALDHITVGYERVLGKNLSLRFRFGYIGLWQSSSHTERILRNGWLVRAGPKLTLPRGSRHNPSARDSHPLAGWYLSPEIMVSYWSDPEVYYIYPNYYWENGEMLTRRTYHTSAALNLTIGRQVMLSEHFTFDIHGGLGYGIRWLNGVAVGPNERYYSTGGDYQFSHAFLGERTPLCASGGLSFGYIF